MPMLGDSARGRIVQLASFHHAAEPLLAGFERYGANFDAPNAIAMQERAAEEESLLKPLLGQQMLDTVVNGRASLSPA